MAIYLTMILLPDIWDRRVDAIMPARRIREMLIRPVAPPRGLLRRLATKFTNPTGSKSMPETLGMYRLTKAGAPVVKGDREAPDLANQLSWVKFRTSDRRFHQTCPVTPTILEGLDLLKKEGPSMTDLIDDGAKPSFRPQVASMAPSVKRPKLPAGWEQLVKLQGERPFLWADLMLARELSRIFQAKTAFVMQQDVFNGFVEQGYWEFRDGLQRYATWSHVGKDVTIYRYELPDTLKTADTIGEGELTREDVERMLEEHDEQETEERLELTHDEWATQRDGDYARFDHARGLMRFFDAATPFPMSAMPIGPGADLVAEEAPLSSRR